MYYRPPVRRGKSKPLIILTVLVILVVLLDILSGGKIRFEVRRAVAFLSQSTNSVTSHLWGSSFFSTRAALQAENRTLTTQLEHLSERAAASELLQQENDTLRQLAHLSENTPGVTAPIISSISSSPYGTFLIGVGVNDHLAKGDLVLTDGGFVIGQVSEIGRSTALISEILAPGASFDATLNNAAVHVEGEGGGNGRLEAPRGLGIAVGDVVVVPQFRQRGIGVVGAIASSSASASQHVYLRIPTSLSKLQFVYVTSTNN